MLKGSMKDNSFSNKKGGHFFLKQSSLMENWIRCAWNPTWSHFRFPMWNLKPLVTDLIILTTRLKCLWVHMESLVIWWLSRGETHNQNLMQPIRNQSVYWKYVGSSHFRACAFYIFRETGTHVTLVTIHMSNLVTWNFPSRIGVDLWIHFTNW